MDPRLVFMGSPEFAVPSLAALVDSYEVAGVVTQPDRPAGRGRSLKPPPVKLTAQENHIPLIQPSSLRKNPVAIAQLKEWAPDAIIVAAFGQILRQDVLELAEFGCINVHASLLPRWRGAAPINATLLHGDAKTGVTIMKMDAGVDTGPVLSQRSIEIEEGDNAGTLSDKLANLGAELLLDTLPKYFSGELKPQPQDQAKAVYAPMLKKEDGLLDFTQPAAQLARQVRAYFPWPGTYTTWNGQTFKIQQAHAVKGENGPPGKPTIYQGNPAFSTAQGLLVLDMVQPAGKKAMRGAQFLMGARNWIES
jgi:methionyl-tRNA formyltransferase